MAKEKSRKVLHDELRAVYLDKVVQMLTDAGEEVLRTASNEIAIPCVDSEGNDEYIVVTIKVPTGGKDGEGYDAYGCAEEYRIKCKEKAERALEMAKKKAEKIARDKAQREALAKARAEHQKKKGEE